MPGGGGWPLLGHTTTVYPFSAGTVFDVCSRQILTHKDGTRTERNEIFMVPKMVQNVQSTLDRVIF